MKNFLIGSLFFLIFTSLIGCQQNEKHTSDPENITVQEDMEGFIEPNHFEQYLLPVREYMYYRTQAVLHNDINILWNQYPKLKEDIDRKQGINIEKFEVETFNESFRLIDANFSLESYERIKVKTMNKNEAIVLVHGSISYIRDDFKPSGGEYLIKVFLIQQDGSWTVSKTDEYLLHEYKEWLKNQNNK